MTRLRYAELARKPMDVLDMTSLTPDEFQLLVPAVETAFQAHMALWRLDGKPRTARRFTVYKNCPLPTPEDRLLFVLDVHAARRRTLMYENGRISTRRLVSRSLFA